MTKIQVGSNAEEEFSFTQKDVNDFIKLSGDSNPIHFDTEYASKTIFKKPIVHGFLSSSIISKLIGTNLPGEGSIYLFQDLKFYNPVFVDNKYLAKVEVVNIDGDIIKLETVITDVKTGGKIVLGNAKIKYIGNKL
ncbi:MaoC family dehydratase [Bacteroidota bacterium]